ncbi:MAG: transposase [Patescibacteria group bacterium]
MQRKFDFAPDEYYHIYNRGTDKRIIFLDASDYSRFILLLYVANKKETIHISDLSNWQGESLTVMNDNLESENLVEIGCYCLMPNHFHLLIREKEENGISLFMKKLLTGYSMYFNIKYQRTGKLFEGPFKAKHVADDDYLRYLFAYIHLNPVKITDPKNWERKIIPNQNLAKLFLKQYEFSSYPYFSSKEKTGATSMIINLQAFPDYFQTERDFHEFIDDWLSYDDITVKESP